ncbi:MAG: asparaginyl-tRNA synthetase [Satyrvirus sp.]|uniref:Asparaginyl-tRNA synthetase n=1 Tax=Satyrvirus sp. TaxID=2487771 RepID=A0A3G5AEC1_9VIRU|nr:MAG: asparaginyl-tRNA synthetase [Satyrvirus sp.]
MEKSISLLTKGDEDSQIIICGWVDRIRYYKSNIFFELRDGPLKNDIVQCIGTSECSNFCKESYVEVQGIVKKVPEKHSTNTGIEFHVQKILCHSPSNPDISGRLCASASYDTQLDERHIYVRGNTIRTAAAITDLVLRTLRKTFKSFGCYEIVPPMYGDVKCEGGSNVFVMNHLGTPVYMTQSSQMYLECMVPALGNTYCIQPSFRAEKSHTRRHLTCFTHAECELHGFQTFDDFIFFLKHFLNRFFGFIVTKDTKGILKNTMRNEKLSIYEFVEDYIKKDFIVMSHSEAVSELVKRSIKKSDGSDYMDLDDIPEAAERNLIDSIDKIVLLTKFPSMTKAFYTASDPTDKARSLSVDIEFPGVGEIFGCSMREYDYEKLREKLELFTLRDVSDKILDMLENMNHPEIVSEIKTKIELMEVNNLRTILMKAILVLETHEKNLPEYKFDLFSLVKEKYDTLRKEVQDIPYKSYQWYFDLRKYGSGKTGGFGLGVERLVAWLTGAYTVKEVTMFPRFDGRLSP